MGKVIDFVTRVVKNDTREKTNEDYKYHIYLDNGDLVDSSDLVVQDQNNRIMVCFVGNQIEICIPNPKEKDEMIVILKETVQDFISVIENEKQIERIK